MTTTAQKFNERLSIQFENTVQHAVEVLSNAIEAKSKAALDNPTLNDDICVYISNVIIETSFALHGIINWSYIAFSTENENSERAALRNAILNKLQDKYSDWQITPLKQKVNTKWEVVICLRSRFKPDITRFSQAAVQAKWDQAFGDFVDDFVEQSLEALVRHDKVRKSLSDYEMRIDNTVEFGTSDQTRAYESVAEKLANLGWQITVNCGEEATTTIKPCETYTVSLERY